MGRQSCSIQRPVLKIEADANFKIAVGKHNRKPDVTFIERKNMMKKAQNKSNNKLNLNRKDVSTVTILRKTCGKSVLAASALTLALVVGNQSTLEF